MEKFNERTQEERGSESERTERQDTAQNRACNIMREDIGEDKNYYGRVQNGGNDYTHSFIPGTISPIENASVMSVSTSNPTVDYIKSWYSSKFMCLPQPRGKQESSRKDVLQPDVAYSDIQSTPRNECDDDISQKPVQKAVPKKKKSDIQEEDLKYLQKLLYGLVEIGGEEAVGDGEEGDGQTTKKSVPSI